MKKNILILLFFITVVSCKEKTQEIEKTEIKPKNQIQPKTDLLKENSDAIDEIKFMKVDMANFPISEETSFDTYDESYRENHPDGRVYKKLKKNKYKN
ncbi:hypothetical protein [Chryseobacterium mucoviscidosis]|uniref:Lipoprotein n=1 Tax=Chryseobacterium mucoviscidosis TaxID=1945581 RepID=A0A202C8E1_9FLAO|nr:hypothetical protein [Chryseobacterium mucoviscidosis]OVE59914.1 hypothetical protein B0E34_04780 [Chryseobacterium mucoviscidosis]